MFDSVWMYRVALRCSFLDRDVIFLERHGAVESSDDPALELPQVFSAAVIDHGVGLNTALDHAIEAMPQPLPGLGRIVSDEHVSHDVLRLDPGTLKLIDAAEEDFLFLQIVPCRIQAALGEAGISILDGGERRSGFVIDEPDVDALT